MLAAGETAGDLERLLRRSADYCKRVSKQLAARIEALAEPIMIVVIGLVIFFGVLSFLLPVFEAMDRMMEFFRQTNLKYRQGGLYGACVSCTYEERRFE